MYLVSLYLCICSHTHIPGSPHTIHLLRVNSNPLVDCICIDCMSVVEIPAKNVTAFLGGSLCDGVTSKWNCSSAVSTKLPTTFAGAEETVAHLAHLHQPLCSYLLKSGTLISESLLSIHLPCRISSSYLHACYSLESNQPSCKALLKKHRTGCSWNLTTCWHNFTLHS